MVKGLVNFLMGILVLVLGFLVKYKQWAWLIAGYNTSSRKEKDKYDKEALCSGVGHFLFLLAGILFVISLGEFLGATWLIRSGWALFVIATLVFLIYANTGNRYRKE